MLIKLGIDTSRLESRGLGESKPVSDNSTPEGKANNRRVEFIRI
jgi:outer membrane protein OmpA-like peptidoglycan-associated protein